MTPAGAPTPAPQLLLFDTSAVGAIDLANRVREQHRSLKILSLAVEPPAGSLPDFPHKHLAHLPKPFAISALLRMVRGLLDSSVR